MCHAPMVRQAHHEVYCLSRHIAPTALVPTFRGRRDPVPATVSPRARPGAHPEIFPRRKLDLTPLPKTIPDQVRDDTAFMNGIASPLARWKTRLQGGA
jgi:hypothetical protein